MERLSIEPHEKLITIATVLWSIWFARNKRVWESVVLSPTIAVALGSKHVTDWRQVWRKKNSNGNKSVPDAPQDRVKWKAPDTGCLKINVDASVRENEDHYSVGMAVRDHERKFVAGKVMKIGGKVSVLEADTVGVLEALSWSKEFSNNPVIIETDSMLTVSAVKRNTMHYLELGSIFQQCRGILAERSDLNLVFVNKLANSVAHEMARLPCELNSCEIFMSPPQILLKTIMYNSSSIL